MREWCGPMGCFQRRSRPFQCSATVVLLATPLLPGSRGFLPHFFPGVEAPAALVHSTVRQGRIKISGVITGVDVGLATGEITGEGGIVVKEDVSEEKLPELDQEEVRRYSRHLILSDVGVVGQQRLKASSVLAVGAGGLGSPALLYLAAAGVGHLGLVDDDVVDKSNLQRQVIHGTSTLGKAKVVSARERILDVNPHIDVSIYHEQLTSGNALQLLEGYDVVLDGSDNLPTKYLVSDACEILGVPNVYGAIQGFEGQASVFTYQATEVVKIILGKGDVLSGRLLLYDAMKMRFKESILEALPNRPPVTGLVDYQGFCGFSATPKPSPTAAAPVADNLQVPGEIVDGDGGESEVISEGFQRITPREVVKQMQQGWAPYVLDVRLPQEAEISSLPFVDKVCPHRKVADVVDELPKEGDLLVHCKVGGRSAKACVTLSEYGIPKERLFSMEGGIVRWAEEIDHSLAVY